MNPNSFSVAINQNPQTTHKIIKGKNKPSYDYIVSILSTYPDISADWLMMGREGGIANSNTEKGIVTLKEIVLDKEDRIKLLEKTILSLEKNVFYLEEKLKSKTPQKHLP